MVEIITISQSRNSTPVTKIKLLMLLREIIAVYCEIHSVGKLKYLILTASGTQFIVITGLLTVKYAEELFRMKVTDLEYCIVF
jgi:hypothetical protein